jgi:hydrogenase assembly chaperone HypC/HupF
MMCIGIPMRVLEASGATAWCEGRGERQRINMLMVGDCPAGSWVLVFLGVARDKLTDIEAEEINQTLDELEAILRGDSGFEGRLPDFAGPG